MIEGLPADNDELVPRPLAVRVGERFRFPTPPSAGLASTPSSRINLCRLYRVYFRKDQ
jgi:hypothetical protein